MDLSIITISYNTRAMTLECLRSVYAQTRETSFEVVVVDNASRDGSAAAIAATFAQVHLIRNDENRGFAAANNEGLRVARGRYVLLLNPDTLVLGDGLRKMVAYMDAHPDIGCAGCQVLLNETEIQQTCFRFPSPLNVLLDLTGLARLFPRSRLCGRYWMGSWDRESERDVDVVSGMFMLVRREALAQVGLMDEDYFVYAEEADWCYRFWKHGWRCVFTPVAQIIHREGGGQSTRQVSARMYVQLQKSILIFHRKNRGRAAWLATKMMFSLVMLARWGIFGVAAAFPRGERLRAKVQQTAAAARFHWLGCEPTT